MNEKIMNLKEHCGKNSRWLTQDFEKAGIYATNNDVLDAIYEQVHRSNGSLATDSNVLTYLVKYGVIGDVCFAVSSTYTVSKGIWLFGKRGLDYESAEKLAHTFETLKPNSVKN